MADTPPLPNQTFIQSKLPADNGYGQNGYRGPSSDLPGKHTSTNFLPKTSLDAGYKADDYQTRKVDAKPIATHPGMEARTGDGQIPTVNMRPVTRKAK